MKRLNLVSIVILLFTLKANAASFDCAKAKSQIEKAICADAHLGSLDEKLGVVYLGLRSNLTDVAKNKLRAHQSLWIKGLSSVCPSESKNKDATKFISCLSNSYKSRVTYLESFSQPIAGIYRYPALGANSNISIELFDGNSPAANLTNRFIEKISKGITGEDELEITISPVAKSIISLQADYTTYGGAHPDFGQNSYYFDLLTPKQLKADFFFNKSKVTELARTILKSIKTGADKETLDCYESIDEKYISDFFNSELVSVRLGTKNISIQLGVPRYCRALDVVDIDMKLVKPFMTESYLALIR